MGDGPVGHDGLPHDDPKDLSPSSFEPEVLSTSPPSFYPPSNPIGWISMLSSPCSFAPQHFLAVMDNLIHNPNLTSSHLFRAEILYDSTVNDVSASDAVNPEMRPRCCDVPPRYVLQRTVVRRLVPRNPTLDKALVQTCHMFQRRSSVDANAKAKDNNEETETNLVIYVPHVEAPDDVPFYHPTVRVVAFLHSWKPMSEHGIISVHYRLFPNSELTPRLERTALALLRLIHKHGRGRAAGYRKRVHHDVVVPQAPFQDTYTALKLKYAKRLIKDWVEQTDPAKHVFEDLGIAAFLIELWKEMYEIGPQSVESSKPRFPGFVDIGCGNGVLVYVLNEEGFRGWGFDARQRKTWDVLFPEDRGSSLREMLLVPDIMCPTQHVPKRAYHPGVFPDGTFVISNHADELTPWTPLLAFLSKSPFFAIPCCSHNFVGARFRVSPSIKGPSAYATLCQWVTNLAEEVGFVPEHEKLRIPSTRNAAILGRQVRDSSHELSDEDRRQLVRDILAREQGTSVREMGQRWLDNAEKLLKGKASGH
ncbi:hypothetical protein BDY21DRAFT_284143 [Lineolata rhizophorae]|uniref:tRNA (uracil-O(2)-)-methyltransferase n=1 Tax=Lineolata rhizophorae TaxID=578093 RepID=A0A6A6P3V5_9PEZI|nr:hypothetical protein BDY21DRAFT_284143 [Lineolata rhizophorae]